VEKKAIQQETAQKDDLDLCNQQEEESLKFKCKRWKQSPMKKSNQMRNRKIEERYSSGM
jgi:hypothetical protein